MNKPDYAELDKYPTHLWIMDVDRDGRKSFRVLDGESRVVVSGALHGDGSLAMRSVNVMDVRGNVVKSHPPMSCEYLPKPKNCVEPSRFEYDAQSKLTRSFEPDAGESRLFYDGAGRLRATQNQLQINEKSAIILGYDHLDRIVFSGKWKHGLDENQLRLYFTNANHQFAPSIAELDSGTITRSFYDAMPSKNVADSLSVILFEDELAEEFGVNSSVNSLNNLFANSRGRLAAVISDVGFDDNNNVVRHASSFVYDKYGQVIGNFVYNGNVAEDSLKFTGVLTNYDIAGKVMSVKKFPYGFTNGGKAKAITERFEYDSFGRLGDLYVTYANQAESKLASYEYYPTDELKKVLLGENSKNPLTYNYDYHISGALNSFAAKEGSNKGSNENSKELYSELLYYENCEDCTPEYNGNISRAEQYLAHTNHFFANQKSMIYHYDFMNRLTKAQDVFDDRTFFDETFDYDMQGRITAQRRDANANNKTGGEYHYAKGTNKLTSVSNNAGGVLDNRNMSLANNFIYDEIGNLIEDKSKNMKIEYDYRGMPTTFKMELGEDSLMLSVMYDGSGNRISKIRSRKVANETTWTKESATHYTGLGTEIRENITHNETRIVTNMPQGLGRYGAESANSGLTVVNSGTGNVANSVPTFEWFIKNHLGSTMLVYGTSSNTEGTLKAAYDYRTFGEQVNLNYPTDKVTETFTGKELDEETSLNYFGARYLDASLGLWTSVDAKRQFASPYLYVGNGGNAVNGIDGDGNEFDEIGKEVYNVMQSVDFRGSETLRKNITRAYNDKSRYYKIRGNSKSEIRPSSKQEPGFSKTYDVSVPFVEENSDFLFDPITYKLIGHELSHPYKFSNPGHNSLPSINSSSEYLNQIENMAKQENPDPIYLDDFRTAKEMGLYEDKLIE